MNYIELIERLKKVTPEDYEFEARVLIETFTDYKMSYIFSHRDEQIVGEHILLMKTALFHVPILRFW